MDANSPEITINTIIVVTSSKIENVMYTFLPVGNLRRTALVTTGLRNIGPRSRGDFADQACADESALGSFSVL